MENLASYIFLATIILISVLTLRIIRRPKEAYLRDPGEAILEFGNAFPKEAVRAALMDEDATTTFMRLADGKTGLAQIVGRNFVVRLIKPGQVAVNMTDDGRGLILEFDDDSMIGGEYRFASTEDAAEVSLWICGSFGLTMAAPENSQAES